MTRTLFVFALSVPRRSRLSTNTNDDTRMTPGVSGAISDSRT